ncbi:hypothetical protein [Herbidospora mongoliensis]|uniref:hypothetical protein n=1 Tax=Herbidospora mongoliensis TaxID=688067 RepID=UPI000B09820C|nr:hypothetical protein [Herbidospora mongoliensis]
MRFHRFACAITLAGLAAVGMVVPAHAKPADPYSPEKWGIISRNSAGNASAFLRLGPWGRIIPTDPVATQAPPFGVGSLGFIAGGDPDHIQFGNEVDFAGTRLADIHILRYWIFTGADADVFPTIKMPTLNLEVNPNQGMVDYTSLVYLPNESTSPSAPVTKVPGRWQQYDASATNSKWFLTRPVPGVIGCTQAVPCSFAELKAQLPNAAISYSVAFNKGSQDGPFFGAVDGLLFNNTLYDFEPLGVRKFQPVL